MRPRLSLQLWSDRMCVLLRQRVRESERGLRAVGDGAAARINAVTGAADNMQRMNNEVFWKQQMKEK